MNNIAEKIKEFAGTCGLNCSFKLDEPVALKTTFKIGGKAQVYAEPEDFDSLKKLVSFIKENKIKNFILGGGSNIVFCDEFFEGVVVSTAKLKDIRIKISEENGDVSVYCQSGATMGQLVNFCTQNELWGFQQFAGLPGSVGGAVFMNARCFDREISNVLLSAEYIDLNDLETKEYEFNPGDWAYKVSPFQTSMKILLSVTFRVVKHSISEHNLLIEENKKYINERKSKGHFDFPSAGSVFRNNHEFGKPSGKIIDECGLRGHQIGNAQIAPFHGNFIINTGGATQKDVKNLVEFTVNSVKEKTGFTLEPEIIFVN